jgi:beta-lactamase family protein
MTRHRPRHAAGRRPLVAALLVPVLAVALVLGLSLVLAVGGALRAAGHEERPAGAPTSDTGALPTGPPAGSGLSLAAETHAAARRAAGARADRERADAALAAVAGAAATARGDVHVVVLGTDGRELLAGPGADQPEYTASLVKLLVVEQLFARDAAGLLTLSDADLSLMERAVTASDDDAMSVLWDRFDGAELVTAATAESGLRSSTLPAVAGQWGEARTTARDTAAFLAGLDDHLAADDLATLTGWMGSPAAIARDGFDQRWGLLAPAVTDSTAVATKQGWMCCLGQRRQLHSVGLLADGRTVVLLGDFPVSTSWARAEEALDTAAQAAVSGTWP